MPHEGVSAQLVAYSMSQPLTAAGVESSHSSFIPWAMGTTLLRQLHDDQRPGCSFITTTLLPGLWPTCPAPPLARRISVEAENCKSQPKIVHQNWLQLNV
jgi:hypothetical protein